MNIILKTPESKYFFSGDINLNMNKELSLDITEITQTQLFDIIEAEYKQNLIVSDINAVKKRHEMLKFGTEDTDIRLEVVETTVKDYIAEPVSFWGSAEW